MKRNSLPFLNLSLHLNDVLTDQTEPRYRTAAIYSLSLYDIQDFMTKTTSLSKTDGALYMYKITTSVISDHFSFIITPLRM